MLVAPNPGPEVLGAESALQGRMLASVQRVKEGLSFKIPENKKQENSEQEIHKKSHKNRKLKKIKKNSPNVDVGGVCNCVGEGITMRVGGFRL